MDEWPEDPKPPREVEPEEWLEEERLEEEWLDDELPHVERIDPEPRDGPPPVLHQRCV